MKIFKKILFSMLITGSISSMAFGMGNASIGFDKEGLKNLKIQLLYIFATINDIEKVKEHLAHIPKEERVSIVMGLYDYYCADSNVYKRETALHVAALNGNLEVARVLLESVPEAQRVTFVMAKNQIGVTALHMAASRGHLEIARMLLEFVPVEQRTALVFSKNLHGWTALHYAAINGYAEIVRMLIEVVPAAQRAAFVITKNQVGWTSLHHAAISGSLEIASMLIELVPVTQRMEFVMAKPLVGYTALNIAEEEGHLELSRMLAEYYPQHQEPLEEEQPTKQRTNDDDGRSSTVPAPSVQEGQNTGFICNIQ